MNSDRNHTSPLRTRPASRWLAAALTVMATAACSDEPSPTAPGATEPDPAVGPPGQQFATDHAVFSDRTHLLRPDEFELAASREEMLQGRYRFISVSGDYPRVEEDDFIVASDPSGAAVVRIVLDSRMEGEALVVETGHAYWHDVIESGTYRVTIPFDGRNGPTLDDDRIRNIEIGLLDTSTPLPPVESHIPFTPLCPIIEDLLAGEPEDPAICGKAVSRDVSKAGFTVGIQGTLDSLNVVSGDVRVTGDMYLELVVESGGVSGGRRPRFTPCDRGNYIGCIATPTGATLISWLRQFAPSIPEASLPAVRLCVPGTPIRVRAGYWEGWTWHWPVFEECRIADIGELPVVTLPHVETFASEIRPRVTGQLTMQVKGDGKLTLRVPIPYLALEHKIKLTDDLEAKVGVGVFVQLSADVRNTGATVQFTLDDTGVIGSTWDEGGGAVTGEVTDKNRSAQILHIDNPDSVIVRLGIPVKAEAELCVSTSECFPDTDSTSAALASVAEAPSSDVPAAPALVVPGYGDPTYDPASGFLDEFKIGAKLGAVLHYSLEGTWSRPQIHPTDPAVDNWKVSVDQAYEFGLKAGISFPFSDWIGVPLDWEDSWEFGRVAMADYWGQAYVQVTANTTGIDPDDDGYSVELVRVDTLPAVHDEGTEPVRPPEELERPLRLASLDPVGSNVFGAGTSWLPCQALYSDYLVKTLVPFGRAIEGARALGVDVPNYAMLTPCPLLVAEYDVQLRGVADNCSVTDGATRRVWLQQANRSIDRGDTTYVDFEVVCASAGGQGDLRLYVPPAFDPGPGAVHVELNGFDQGSVPDTDTLVLTRLEAGTKTVNLVGYSEYCTFTPFDIVITADETTSVDVPESCVPPPPDTEGFVEYRTAVSGDGTDDDGYEMRLDGLSYAAMPVDGATAIPDLPGETPFVFFVAGVADNCQPQAPNPQAIALNAARAPVTVDFDVICRDAVPDSVAGVVEGGGAGLPLYLRTEDGTTFLLSGPLAPEFRRLTGTPVLAWGTASATGLSVHGYDLKSSLGDDRWRGIVLDRADGTWLIEKEAIRIVDPPQGLLDSSGSYVWVEGERDSFGIRTRLYGVIREGS